MQLNNECDTEQYQVDKSRKNVLKISSRQHVHGFFLGGLSLHLNHLIAWHAGISFWQFGTLPIGIFLSNLDSRHLMTSPRTLLGQF